MAQIDVVSSRDGESTTVVPNHRHCQSTVCAAAGHQEDGSTWAAINSQNNFTNLPSNWKDKFAANISSAGMNNITYDFVAVLQILNQVAGDIKNSQFTPFNVEFQDNHGNHLDQFTADNSGGTKRVILGKDIELKIDGVTAWKFNTLGSLADGSSGGSDASGSGTDTQIFNLQSNNLSFVNDYAKQKVRDVGTMAETGDSSPKTEEFRIDGNVGVYYIQWPGTNPQSEKGLIPCASIPQKYITSSSETPNILTWKVLFHNTSGEGIVISENPQVRFEDNNSFAKTVLTGQRELWVSPGATNTYTFTLNTNTRIVTWKFDYSVGKNQSSYTNRGEQDMCIKPSGGAGGIYSRDKLNGASDYLEVYSPKSTNTDKKYHQYDYLQVINSYADINTNEGSENYATNVAPIINGTTSVFRIKAKGEDFRFDGETDLEDGDYVDGKRKFVLRMYLDQKYLSYQGVIEVDFHVSNESTTNNSIYMHALPWVTQLGSSNGRFGGNHEIIRKTNNLRVAPGETNVYSIKVDTTHGVLYYDLKEIYLNTPDTASPSGSVAATPIYGFQQENDRNALESNIKILKYDKDGVYDSQGLRDEAMFINGRTKIFRVFRKPGPVTETTPDALGENYEYQPRIFIDTRYFRDVTGSIVEWELWVTNTLAERGANGNSKKLAVLPPWTSTLGYNSTEDGHVLPSYKYDSTNYIPNYTSDIRHYMQFDNSKLFVQPGMTNVYKFRYDAQTKSLIWFFEYAFGKRTNGLTANVEKNSPAVGAEHMQRSFTRRSDGACQEQADNDIIILNPNVKTHFKVLTSDALKSEKTQEQGRNLNINCNWDGMNGAYSSYFFRYFWTPHFYMDDYCMALSKTFCTEYNIIETELIIRNDSDAEINMSGYNLTTNMSSGAGDFQSKDNVYTYVNRDGFPATGQAQSLEEVGWSNMVGAQGSGRYDGLIIPMLTTARFNVRYYVGTKQMVIRLVEVFYNDNSYRSSSSIPKQPLNTILRYLSYMGSNLPNWTAYDEAGHPEKRPETDCYIAFMKGVATQDDFEEDAAGGITFAPGRYLSTQRNRIGPMVLGDVAFNVVMHFKTGADITHNQELFAAQINSQNTNNGWGFEFGINDGKLNFECLQPGTTGGEAETDVSVAPNAHYWVKVTYGVNNSIMCHYQKREVFDNSKWIGIKQLNLSQYPHLAANHVGTYLVIGDDGDNHTIGEYWRGTIYVKDCWMTIGEANGKGVNREFHFYYQKG